MTDRSGAYETMRGGQLVFHWVKMAFQILKKNLYIFFGFLVLFVIVYFVAMVPKSDLRYGGVYALSVFQSEYFFREDKITKFTRPNGSSVEVTWGDLSRNKALEKRFDNLVNHFWYALIVSLILGITLFASWIKFLAKRGKKESQDKHIRGATLGDIKSHDALIKEEEIRRNKKSPFRIAGYKIPPSSEFTNCALIGAQGAGKSAALLDIINQKRALGDKMFIFDPSGEFTRKFYREGVDYILTPSDQRAVSWDVWSEGATHESYRSTSQTLIPLPKGGDPFWVNASRVVFEALCETSHSMALRQNEIPSIEKFLDLALRTSDQGLAVLLRGTDATSVFNEDSEKTAASIRSTMSTYLHGMRHLRDRGKKFSFNGWLQEDSDACVFIPIKAGERDLFKTLIAVWVEHFAKAVLSQPVDHYGEHNITAFLDEFLALGEIPTLLSLLAEGRKYHFNCLLGLQSDSQIAGVYGRERAKSITDVIRTYVVFRCNGKDGAKWASETLCSQDVEEANENLSMGAHDVRDSVSIGRHRKEERKLVSASELIGLQDLNGYLRFGAQYPVLRFEQIYPQLDDIAQPIVSMASGDSQTAPDVSSDIPPLPVCEIAGEVGVVSGPQGQLPFSGCDDGVADAPLDDAPEDEGGMMDAYQVYESQICAEESDLSSGETIGDSSKELLKEGEVEAVQSNRQFLTREL